MTNIAKIASIALAGALAFSAASAAEPAPAANSIKPPDSATTLTTGSVDVDPPFAQRMKECMAIWDKGTHMTKDQWRRSCQTTLRSLTTE
jgi:ABC-type glycerol-3-phosphate transport system substrate-binding protein